MATDNIQEESNIADCSHRSLDRIHHIAVVVPDIQKGINWYTKNFHCTVEYVDATWALLNFANTQLALVLSHQHPGHFAVTRSDADKFGKLTRHRDGLKAIDIKDRAGNPLEILKDDERSLSYEKKSHQLLALKL